MYMNVKPTFSKKKKSPCRGLFKVLLNEDKYLILLAFYYSCSDSKSLFTTRCYHSYLSCRQGRYDRCVIVHYLKQSACSGQLYQGGLAIIERNIRLGYLHFHKLSISHFWFRPKSFHLFLWLLR